MQAVLSMTMTPSLAIDPPQNISLCTSAYGLILLYLQLSVLYIYIALFYLLVCCFVGSSLVISCVTSASQFCQRLFEIQNSVLTIISSDSFVISTYQMISNARWLTAIYSQWLRIIIFRLGSCDASASFENSFCLYLRVWVLCLRIRFTLIQSTPGAVEGLIFLCHQCHLSDLPSPHDFFNPTKKYKTTLMSLGHSQVTLF